MKHIYYRQAAAVTLFYMMDCPRGLRMWSGCKKGGEITDFFHDSYNGETDQSQMQNE